MATRWFICPMVWHDTPGDIPHFRSRISQIDGLKVECRAHLQAVMLCEVTGTPLQLAAVAALPRVIEVDASLTKRADIETALQALATKTSVSLPLDLAKIATREELAATLRSIKDSFTPADREALKAEVRG